MKITRIFILFCLTSVSLMAQKTQDLSISGRDYNQGLEYFNREKYGAALDCFSRAIASAGSSRTELKASAMYHAAISAIELYNLDSEFRVYEFINTFPENPLVSQACFRLGGYLYWKKSWSKAVNYYEKVDRYMLDVDQLSEYWFNKGFSYYSMNDFENARLCFYEIKDIDSKFSSPALYYYSHIAYDQNNYGTALNGFIRLLDDPTFSPIAPYYVTQINFLQKNYSEVIAFAPPLMDSVSEKRAGEMAKIIGDSYYALGRYKEALPYLERYREEGKSLTIGDRYQLAFIYYQISKYREAASLFESIAYTRSEISQSAMYNLADCYLKTGDKNKARKAFSIAAGMDFNLAIQEDALFNYAKVTYELSYNPFNEAILAFNRYLSLYPASARTDEAYNYLVSAYMNTRNYKMAMESLGKIRDKDDNMEKALQRVAFFRGLELFTNLRFADAIECFDLSLKYAGYDPVIRARTLYWLGEAYFRMDDPGSAEEYYTMFLKDDFAFRASEYIMLRYSLGYISFMKKDFPAAKKWFSEYLQMEKKTNTLTYADALNRLGDTRFIESNYKEAIESYARVIVINKADVDYAYFQKGFCEGLVDLPNAKIETFRELISKFPNSSYLDDAFFELGKTYAQLDMVGEAMTVYQRIINEFPNSAYSSRTLVQLGLVSYSAHNTSQALEYYKKVVSLYPGTPESAIALKSIKDIYVELNNVDEYLAFVEETGKVISIAEQDSLMYSSAEAVYLSGDCATAIKNLDAYIARFTTGAFLLNAHYYRADCLLKTGNRDSAIPSLEYIIAQPLNLFTEPALVAASRYYYEKEDYNRAAAHFLKITETGEKKSGIAEAEIGLMRCYFKLGEYANSITAANQVLLQDKLQTETSREASFIIANSCLKQNNIPAALDWFTKVAVEVNSIEGAEAKFRVAELTFLKGESKKAEEVIYEYIDMNTPHAYWMGKSFLLLAEIFRSAGDEFQALQTLQSIIDYYEDKNDGIREAALNAKNAITNEATARDQVVPAEQSDTVNPQ